MFYPDHVVEEVRMGNDIVDVISQQVKLTRKGSSYFGLCPFHNESTPSFSVSPDKQLYHCFGCGASGNVYSFVMQRENFDFKTAIQHLAERIHYTLPEDGVSSAKIAGAAKLRQDLYDIHVSAARYFFNNLANNQGADAAEYLTNRQLGPKIRRKFGLGFSPDTRDGLSKHLIAEGFAPESIYKSGLVNQDKKGSAYDRFRGRIMFPIFDIRGKVIGFGGRIIGKGEPKYLNSPETAIFEKRKNLYGLNFARQSGKREMILVEGYMDVISLFEAGIDNVVAALGTAFTMDHVKLLKKYADTVYILFDSDEAGEKAALRAIPLLVDGGIKTKVIKLPDAKDPDEFVKKYGIHRFLDLLPDSLSHIAFRISCTERNYDLSDTGQKIDFTKEVSKILAELTSAIELDAYLDEAALITGIKREAIEAEIFSIRGKLPAEIKKKTFTPMRNRGQKQEIDAKKGIIYLAADDPVVCKEIKKHLEPYEMGDKVYEKVIEMIYDINEKNGVVCPAELINHFEDAREQQLISDIFHTVMALDDRKLLKQAINDQIKIIKRAYIDKKASETIDMKELQELIKYKRNIEKLNISLKEG